MSAKIKLYHIKFCQNIKFDIARSLHNISQLLPTLLIKIILSINFFLCFLFYFFVLKKRCFSQNSLSFVHLHFYVAPTQLLAAILMGSFHMPKSIHALDEANPTEINKMPIFIMWLGIIAMGLHE